MVGDQGGAVECYGVKGWCGLGVVGLRDDGGQGSCGV